MLISSALSTKSDLEEACREAATSARKALHGESVDLCIVFASDHFANVMQQVPVLISEELSPKHLIGCSGGGIIGDGFEVEGQAAISVTALSLPGVDIHAHHVLSEELPDGDTGQAEWIKLTGLAADQAEGFILLPDPSTFSTQQLLDGLDFAYPTTPKVGGLASGSQQPGGNALFLDRQCHHSGAIVLGLAGNIILNTMVAQGCKPCGKVGQITKAAKNVLVAIDGKPAIKFLQEQIQSLSGDELALAQRTPMFLGIAMNPFATDEPSPGDFLIRNLLSYDPQTGSLAVGEMLSLGRSVQFHLRDGTTSADDLRHVLQTSTNIHLPEPKQAKGALLFSCVGRGEHLYGEPHHDSKVFHEILGRMPLGGFFCSGEIGPVHGSTYLHGYTSSFAVFAEKGS